MPSTFLATSGMLQRQGLAHDNGDELTEIVVPSDVFCRRDVSPRVLCGTKKKTRGETPRLK